MKSVIVYGSTGGMTEEVADELGELLGAIKLDAADATADDIDGCDLLILGASTWYEGELQEDMADFVEKFTDMDISVVCAAIFGTGDQYGYAETFVDGIEDIALALDAKGIRRIGDWPVKGYEFEASRAQTGDHFKGLVLDLDNEASKTTHRLTSWVEVLKSSCLSLA